MTRSSSLNRFVALLGLVALAMSIVHVHDGHGARHSGPETELAHAGEHAHAGSPGTPTNPHDATVSEDAAHHEHSALPDLGFTDCAASCRTTSEESLAASVETLPFDLSARASLPGRRDRFVPDPFRGLPAARGPPALASA